MTIDYKKIFHVIIIPTLLVTGFIFGNIYSCNKTANQVERMIIIKKDSTDQVKIDSLQQLITQRDTELAVANYQIDQVENQRADVKEKYQVRYKLVEIENSDELYKQNRIWLNPFSSPSVTLRALTGKRYEFDSLDQVKLAQKHAEYDFMKEDNKLLTASGELKDSKIQKLEYSLSDQKLISKLQSDQIKKMESFPVPEAKSRAWYIDAGIIIGSAALGYGIRTVTHK